MFDVRVIKWIPIILSTIRLRGDYTLLVEPNNKKDINEKNMLSMSISSIKENWTLM